MTKAQHEIGKLDRTRTEERRERESQGEWERQRVGEQTACARGREEEGDRQELK